MIIRFGMWEINEELGLICKNKPGGDYNIGKSRLWETIDYDGELIWSWLYHLADKKWITSENVNDLNTALCFAQDFFKEEKPKDFPYVSTAKSILVQRNLMD